MPPMGGVRARAGALELECQLLSGRTCEVVGSLTRVILYRCAKIARLRSGGCTYRRPAAVRLGPVENFLLLSKEPGKLVVRKASLAVIVGSFDGINLRYEIRIRGTCDGRRCGMKVRGVHAAKVPTK